jgi:hypothetical protein
VRLGAEARAVDQERDHAVVVGPRAQAGHRVEQLHRLDVAPGLAGGGPGGEQLAEGGLETLLEAGREQVDGGVAGVRGRGEPVLGADERSEPMQPANQRIEGRVRGGRRGGGVGARVDLVPEDGGDQVGAPGEATVEGGEADTGPGGDLSRTGASTPEVPKTSRAASISASMLRWASARATGAHPGPPVLPGVMIAGAGDRPAPATTQQSRSSGDWLSS